MQSWLIISRVDFTNILSIASTHPDPNEQKIQSSCQSFFALFGCALVKALRKMLVKKTPDALS